MNCVPLTTLGAAAGAWSEEQASLFEANWADERISFDRHKGFEKGMFVARVDGKSMEPLIPEGSYCLFRPPSTGSREGKNLLVWHSGVDDPLMGGHLR